MDIQEFLKILATEGDVEEDVVIEEFRDLWSHSVPEEAAIGSLKKKYGRSNSAEGLSNREFKSTFEVDDSEILKKIDRALTAREQERLDRLENPPSEYDEESRGPALNDTEGPEHSRWVKDSRYPKDWNERRKQVYQRDNYECQNCGVVGGPKGEIELHGHHIVQ